MNNTILAALLLLITAIWGWSFPAVKEAVAQYGVLSFLAIRFAIGTSTLGLFTARRLDRKSLRTGAALGVVLASGYLLQTFGARSTTATNNGLITGLFVLFAPMASRLLFGVRIRPVLWVAVGVSLVGLVFLTGLGPDPLCLGDLLTLGSAACYGLHIALLGRYSKEHDSGALALAQLTMATLLFVVMALLTEPLVWPSSSVWTTILATAILATALSFPIQTFVQKRLPAVRTAVLLTMESVFAAVFGYLLAGERLTGVQIAGAALLVGAALVAEVGAALAQRRAVRAFPPEEERRGSLPDAGLSPPQDKRAGKAGPVRVKAGR